jgi:hypothetical protein
MRQMRRHWGLVVLSKAYAMALGWFSLLKTVPWSDVIATAPVVADGAKRLWKSMAKKPPVVPTPVPTAVAGEPTSLAQLQARVAALELGAEEMRAQLRVSSELIQSLAEQNKELVQRVEAHRVRLLWASTGIVALVLAVAWLATR